MLKNLLNAGVLAAFVAMPLIATGCATSQPYRVTGETASVQNDNGIPNQQNPRYLDQKGHYHPEWVDATGR
jgi:hypothetical protein